ncbi:MAG: hypothetical protein KGM49_02965 [Sphingomonadales bacterium]|nr:hypothetical protein [Sphingomonadales bacterium]
MAASLALTAPERLVATGDDTTAFASVRGLWGDPSYPASKASVPAVMPNGDRALFVGWFDNKAEIAARLGVAPDDPARVYAHAVERWGDQAERHIVGAYAAVIDRPGRGEVRLARSPVTAPPLHYHRSGRMVAAASVPRALLALGLSSEIDETRLAMHLHAAPYDTTGGWYKEIEALQLGVVVSVTAETERRARPYSLEHVAETRLRSDAEYQEAAEALLDEAIDRTVAGYRRPGTFLSGGLDSGIVASHLINRLPTGQILPTFTFVNEPGWEARETRWRFEDERPKVEAFAAMHPTVRPTFVDSGGSASVDGMDDLFLLAGMAPASIGLLYPYHGMFAAARQQGCDLLIGAGMGNTTFSNDGARGFVEFLVTGRWRQLRRALAGLVEDHRPLWRRFAALSLVRAAPDPLWRAIVRWRGTMPADFNGVAGALNPDWPGRAALSRSARAADPSFIRPFYRSREEEVASMARQMDADAFDLMQGFQQKFSMAYRDVTRYRPFVEFCWSLPTDQFLRDGEMRHLARRMGRGHLPEETRTERRIGDQHADWHLRIGRRRDDLLAELRGMRDNPQIARLVDLPRLIGLLENFPEFPERDPSVAYQYQIALPSGIAAGRFIRHVSGSNV